MNKKEEVKIEEAILEVLLDFCEDIDPVTMFAVHRATSDRMMEIWPGGSDG